MQSQSATVDPKLVTVHYYHFKRTVHKSANQYNISRHWTSSSSWRGRKFTSCVSTVPSLAGQEAEPELYITTAQQALQNTHSDYVQTQSLFNQCWVVMTDKALTFMPAPPHPPFLTKSWLDNSVVMNILIAGCPRLRLCTANQQLQFGKQEQKC